MSSYSTTGVQVTGVGHAAGSSCRKSRARRRKRGGPLVVRGVAGAVDDGEPGAGDPGGDRLGAGPGAIVEGAGDDERRGADLAEAIERGAPSRPGRRRAGWPRARRGGWRAGSRGSARRGPAGRAAWVAKIGWCLPLGDERGDAVALDPVGEAPRRRPGVRSARPRSAMPARRALEDEARDDVRVRDREPERDPGAERVADDVGGRGAERGEQRSARASAVALDGHARSVGGVACRRGPAGPRR